jgi:hypothetical protein
MIDFSSRENFEKIKYELFRLPGQRQTPKPYEEYHWPGMSIFFYSILIATMKGALPIRQPTAD